MKVTSRNWLNRGLLAAVLFALSSCASVDHSAETSPSVQGNRDIARVQAKATKYEHLQTQLEMKPGTTFLAFTLDEIIPAGNKFMPELDRVEKRYPRQFNKWQEEWLKDGTGVAIRIDENNYYFHLGYRDGADPENDTLSGRSYGLGPTGRQSDPSYKFYLQELTDYFGNADADEIRGFYKAILLALTANDPSGWAEISEEGQTVATDFLAIYNAENLRHIMVGLDARKHPWEIDLSAVTCVASFVHKTGKMADRGGRLIDGSIGDFYGIGQKGSGVGITRNERKALTKKIARHVARTPEGRKALRVIEKHTGPLKDDDVFQGFFEWLNAPKGKAPLSIKQHEKLVDAVLDYLDVVNGEAAAVVGE